MTAAEPLVAELCARGVRLRMLGDGRIGAQPRAALDDNLRAAVRQHRAALLPLLGLAADAEAEGEGERVRALYDEHLTDDERRRLEAEARGGDPVAAVMLLLVLNEPTKERET